MAIIKSAFAYQDLPPAFFAAVEPASFGDLAAPLINTDLAAELGIETDWLGSADGLSMLAGQNMPNGSNAIAMAYCGHQFGQWSGLLGDGRARLIAEAADQNGDLHELHLKGAGPTPYARRGDGLASLGSTIREFIVSEAMAALGVAGSRSLAVVTTGNAVQRNGMEPGGILCRTMRSHLRVGTFQFAASQGDDDHVKALADFAIARLYPKIESEGPDRYAAFITKVAARQAELVAAWMGYGFIHGVMNTDNACISGETIDYGPCAFMDDFSADKTFSSIDRRGRYAWNRQPEMAHWNMARLAESLLPLLGGEEDTQIAAAEAALAEYPSQFRSAFNTVMARKLGLAAPHGTQARQALGSFINDSLKALSEGHVDYTQFFTALTRLAGGSNEEPLLSLFSQPEIGSDWLEIWKEKSGFKAGLSAPTVAAMQASNPVRIARNHLVEQAIADANTGNFQTARLLIKALKDPFTEDTNLSDYETPPLPDEVVTQTFCGT